MKILICGLPGSGKSTLAKPLAKKLGAIWINADDIRKKYNDWDFSLEGRIRQSSRMKHLSDGVVMAGKIAIADFVCPTEKTRLEFNPDYIIWMNTINKGRFEDTNNIFEVPSNANYSISEWFDDINEELDKILNGFINYESRCRKKAASC